MRHMVGLLVTWKIMTGHTSDMRMGADCWALTLLGVTL